MNNNRITQLFGIKYPIIQAGMVWTSGWRLASAVSNAGGLGIIGAGSMYPEVLKEHIQKCKQATSKPFAVNLPLLFPSAEAHIQTIIEEKVPIVFTSAGNPTVWTKHLQANGCKVVHVVSSSKFAQKAEAAGCDAVVAEGFEAGGHNGREETTTLVLVPLVKKSVTIPVIAAGGIGSGAQMLAALALGADAVQIGSRFICTPEASSHAFFKDAIIQSKEGDTLLQMKKTVPVRMLKNNFSERIRLAEDLGAPPEDLKALLGKGRAKKGMFLGEIAEGELEVGQIAAAIENIMPAGELVEKIWQDFLQAKANLIATTN